MKHINKHLLAVIAATAVTVTSLTGCANDTSSVNRNDDDDVVTEEVSSGSHTGIFDVNSDTSNNDASRSDTSSETSSNSETGAVDSEVSEADNTSTVSDASEPDVSEPETNIPANNASVDIMDWPAGVSTAAPTVAFKPVPESDWAPILSNAEMVKAVSDNVAKTDSFVMTCKIEGDFPVPQGNGQIQAEHTYALVVTKDVTYLKSTFTDLTNGTSPSVYEAFKSMEPVDGKFGINEGIATITKVGNEWVCDEAVYVLEDSMVLDTFSTTSLLRYFVPDDARDESYDYYGSEKAPAFVDSDTIITAPITRSEDGNMEITFPEWRELKVETDRFLRGAPFANLIRFPGLYSSTRDLNEYGKSSDGNVVYTIDNDYNLKAIEADICREDYDVHVTIEFSDWNNVLPIEIPEHTVTENAMAYSTQAYTQTWNLGR